MWIDFLRGDLEVWRVWGCLENETNVKAIIKKIKTCIGKKNNLYGYSNGSTEFQTNQNLVRMVVLTGA